MNPLLDNLSAHLKQAIAKSISLATAFKHYQVTPLHMLTALFQEPGGIAAEILHKTVIEEKNLLDILGTLPRTQDDHNLKGGSLSLTLPELNEKAKQALEKAMILAYEYSHNYIGTEHLLHGLLRVSDPQITALLKSTKVTAASLEEQIETILATTSKFPEMDEVGSVMEEIQEAGEELVAKERREPKKSPRQRGNFSALEMFATCLTDKAIQENLDPVIGREKEIERLIHILCRRNKNNPVLVGEPGVGKTAIVEGLAKKIVNHTVPDILKSKKISSLDLALLISGTIYRGEFEARLKQIIEEVGSNPNIILFIDEIHNIIGAGSNQGTLDAANMLKPALARGKLHCIGATTYEEYKKYIGNDPALERRFQAINIEEPSTADTIHILEGIKKYYEDYHRVEITPAAILRAVELSDRYIHDNFLPDKAIDLIDEAAASVRVAEKTDSHTQKKMQLQEKIQDWRQKKEKAILEEQFEKAMKYKKEEERADDALKKLQQQKVRTKKRPHVTPLHVANTLATRLQLDSEVFSTDEWMQLTQLENKLNQKILGQKTAIAEVVQELKRTTLRPKNSDKPLASFLFVGPPGVGKTALGKTLAKEFFHDDKALIQFDMSEFSEGHSVSKILGSPAGYIGHKERNRFTEQIKKRPYTVILFDEIDKAHPDVTKLLLQILDEGTLTDSSGQKIRLRHTIIILTSNVGSEFFRSEGIGFQPLSPGDKSNTIQGTIQSHLKDVLGSPLLSRLSRVCLFYPLSEETIKEMVHEYVKNLQKEIQSTRQITLQIDEKTLQALVEEAKKGNLGARHIESVVYNRFSTAILEQLSGKKPKKILI